MIEIRKKIGEEIVNLTEPQPYSWINISNPTPDELLFLIEKLNIPSDFVYDANDPDERPRIEVEDDIIFIVIRAPLRIENEYPYRIETISIGIILTDKYIITLSNDKKIVWTLLQGKIIAQDFSPKNRLTLIYRIYYNSSNKFLSYLKDISLIIRELEKELRANLDNDSLFELFNVEKTLVYFITSLQSNELTLTKILKANPLRLSEDYKELFEDIIIDIKQAIEVSKIYIHIVRDMMDTFSSVFSNNLNVVMKTLTALTLVFMLPTLVASFYGMNVKLPYETHPYAFYFIFAFSIIITLITIIFFKKRRLF